MKNIYNKLATYFVVVLLIVLSACQSDDSIARRGKPDITVENTSVTINEGGIATFNLAVEYPVNEPIFIRIDVLDDEDNPIVVTKPICDPNSGNGYEPIEINDLSVPNNTWFDSGYFSFGYLGGSGYVASIPAFSDSFEISLEAIRDLIPENPEAIKLRVTSTSTMQATIDEILTINIADNFESNNFGAKLNWDVTCNGNNITSTSRCIVDMDIFLSDFSAYAFTSNCSEFLIETTDPNIELTSELADGTYTVLADMWSIDFPDNFDPVADYFEVALTVRLGKVGQFETTFTVDGIYDSNHLLSSVVQNAGNEIIATIVVINGNYTVFDRNGNLLASE